MATVTDKHSVGEIGGAGDILALHLKVYAGEIIAEFAKTNVMMARHIVKTIIKGKTAQFPVTGTVGTAYHVPGESLLTEGTYLKTLAQGEMLIHTDRYLTSTIFTDDLEELILHYDNRGERSREVGRALAKAMDQALIRVLIRASRTESSDVARPGPGDEDWQWHADMSTDESVFVAAVFRALQWLDENDVPKEDRYCLVSPAQYNLFFTDTTKQLIDVDLNPGANGSMASGRVFHIGGAEIVKTNNMPTAAHTAVDNQMSASSNNDYRLAVTNAPLAVVFHKSAVGTVKKRDVSVEAPYYPEYNGHMIKAQYSMGHGVLRPECSVELSTAVAPELF